MRRKVNKMVMANKQQIGHNGHMKAFKNIVKIPSLLALMTLASCFNAADYGNADKIINSMANSIEKQNPTIASVHPNNIKENDVLIDVRTEEEINISMISGAITKAQFESNIDSYKDKHLIVYCTVGTRATQYAKELKEKNFDASNLYGGVLAWAQAQKSFEKSGEKTNKVHVSSKAFDLLPKGYEGVYP